VLSYMLEIKKHVDMAGETDYIMPLWLPFIPAITSVVSVMLALVMSIAGGFFDVAGFSASFILMFVGGLTGIYVVYKLVERRNEHFRRTHLLYENLLNLLKAKEGSSPEVVSLESTLQEMRHGENEKNAGLYAVLALFLGFLNYVIPALNWVVWFYVAHFLNKDFRKHEVRESRVMDLTSSILKKYGVETPMKFERKFPNRSTILYIVLSIVTLGIFTLYWMYTLANDPNNHFKQHRALEAKLLSALESAKITT